MAEVTGMGGGQVKGKRRMWLMEVLGVIEGHVGWAGSGGRTTGVP